MKRKIGIIIISLLLLSLVPVLGDDIDWSKMDPKVKEKVERGESSIAVIVQFTNLDGTAKKIIANTGKPMKYEYPSINSVAMTLGSEDIKSMASNPYVVRIWADDIVTLAEGVSTANQDEVTIKGYIANDIIKATPVRSQGYTGTGIVVAVLDTGLRKTHQEFPNKVVAEYDFVNNDSNASDDNGHGTEVSSLICGNSMAASSWPPNWQLSATSSNYLGVAPGAKLVPLKVFDASGNGSSSQIMAGMQWCIDNKNKYNIRVVNMSFGFEGQNDGSNPQSQMANSMMDAGLVVCIAAGNDGPDPQTIDIPGDASKVITVGGIKDRTFTVVDDNWIFTLVYPYQMYCVGGPSGCSSRGPTLDGRAKPDIVASAVDMFTAHAYSDSSYQAGVSGTSFATPIVAGACALIIQRHPNWTPYQVKEALMRTASPIPNAGQYDQGAGLINVQKAISYRQASDRSSAIPIILEILKKNKEKNN
ncbi:MAG: S8 family peptidase [Methanofastidiosum sp.]